MLFWPQPHSDGRRKYLYFTLRRERSLVLKHRDVSAYLVSCRENLTLLKWMIGPRQEGWMNSFVTLLSNLKPPSVPWQKHLDFAEANPCKIQWGRRCHRSQSKASIGHIARGRGRFNALLRRFEGATVFTSKSNTCSDLFSLTQEPRIQDGTCTGTIYGWLAKQPATWSSHK